MAARFGRPDVACNASRFLGPSDHGQTKAQWMRILNEDLDRGIRNSKRSESLHALSQFSHGTWSHFSFGDPMKDFRIDRGLYGDTEARRRHLAKAKSSSDMWQHPGPKLGQAPLPEPASPAVKAPMETLPPQPPCADNKEAQPSPSAPRSGPRSPPLPAPVDPAAASTRDSSRPQPHQMRSESIDMPRRNEPPQLPQLWMSQPRTMTPKSPFAASTNRSTSLAGSQAGDRQSSEPLRPPLRRVGSEPGVRFALDNDPGTRFRGYIDPALRLRPSLGAASKISQGDVPDRWGMSTFIFG